MTDPGGTSLERFVVTTVLQVAARAVHSAAKGIEHAHEHTKGADTRALRAALILEEAAEAVEALATFNEVELADALADLRVVVQGTANTYALPLQLVFDEVMRSNMTKHSGAAQDRSGDKGKGEGYEPPQVARVIEDARKRAQLEGWGKEVPRG